MGYKDASGGGVVSVMWRDKASRHIWVVPFLISAMCWITSITWFPLSEDLIGMVEKGHVAVLATTCLPVLDFKV